MRPIAEKGTKTNFTVPPKCTANSQEGQRAVLFLFRLTPPVRGPHKWAVGPSPRAGLGRLFAKAQASPSPRTTDFGLDVGRLR
jgi:hypothetical protein